MPDTLVTPRFEPAALAARLEQSGASRQHAREEAQILHEMLQECDRAFAGWQRQTQEQNARDLHTLQHTVQTLVLDGQHYLTREEARDQARGQEERLQARAQAGFAQIGTRFAETDAKIDLLRKDMQVGFSEAEAKIELLRRDTQAGFADMEARMQAGFADTEARMQAGFADTEARMQAGFADTEARMQAGFVEADTKIDLLRKDMEAGFAELDAKINLLRQDMEVQGQQTRAQIETLKQYTDTQFDALQNKLIIKLVFAMCTIMSLGIAAVAALLK